VHDTNLTQRIVLRHLILVLLLLPLAACSWTSESETEVRLPGDLALDDHVIFGSYNGEPIVWRIINFDDQNNPLLLSERVLTIKSFDAKGNAHTGTQRQQRGSNQWEFSTIRQWLNSSAPAGTMAWWRNPPSTANLWRGYNPYDSEAGFLADTNFSQRQREQILSTSNRNLLATPDIPSFDGGNQLQKYSSAIGTILQNYDHAYYRQLSDKVFLPDVYELYHYLHRRGHSIRAKPTRQAAESNQYTTLSLNEANDCSYWLRTPVAADIPGTNSRGADGVWIRYVHRMGEEVHGAGCGGEVHSGIYGIRPALVLDRQRLVILSGNGSQATPWLLE